METSIITFCFLFYTAIGISFGISRIAGLVKAKTANNTDITNQAIWLAHSCAYLVYICLVVPNIGLLISASINAILYLIALALILFYRFNGKKNENAAEVIKNAEHKITPVKTIKRKMTRFEVLVLALLIVIAASCVIESICTIAGNGECCRNCVPVSTGYRAEPNAVQVYFNYKKI